MKRIDFFGYSSFLLNAFCLGLTIAQAHGLTKPNTWICDISWGVSFIGLYGYFIFRSHNPID